MMKMFVMAAGFVQVVPESVKRLAGLYWMNHRMLKINAVSDGVLR